MKLNLSYLFVLVALAGSLFSCTDHRLGGTLSPVKLRLKTIQSGAAITTYAYDSQNRLATITKSDGSLNALSYDDAGKQYTYFSEYPKASDQTTGLITLYPYNLSGTSFSATQYPIVNSATFFPVKNATFSYGFDTNKHLTGFYKSDGADNASARGGASYTFVGENISTSSPFFGRTTSPAYSYQYDDKINPFFGLFDPAIDPVQRFSRNNVVKADYPSNTAMSMTYEYEYNQQNLPTKRTTKQAGTITEVTTYTYESY
ncbi:hypothetical protein [Spirosoma litoris]